MNISKRKEVVTFRYIHVELSCGMIFEIPVHHDDGCDEEFVIDYMINNITEISYVDIDGVLKVD